MIITDNFVVLNFQKTGSSFVRKVMKDIFLKRRNKNILTRALYKYNILHLGFKEERSQDLLISNYKDQHGCYDQIPDKHKDKLIVSVIRDPYSRLNSIYNFKWWSKYPPISQSLICKNLPNFPNLNFKEFLALQNLENEKLKKIFHIPDGLVIGNQTIYFIRFYFKNHKKVLSNITQDYILSEDFKKDLCKVKFLNSNDLNNELVDFLSAYGFEKKDLDYIKNHGKVNVSKESIRTEDEGKEIINYVNKNEWLLFEIFNSLGYNFKEAVKFH